MEETSRGMASGRDEVLQFHHDVREETRQDCQTACGAILQTIPEGGGEWFGWVGRVESQQQYSSYRVYSLGLSLSPLVFIVEYHR